MPRRRGLGRSCGVTAVDGLRTCCGVSSDGGGRWARAAKRARNDCRSFLGSGCGGVRTGIGEGGAARAWGSSRTGVRTAGVRGRSGVDGGGVAGATLHAGEKTRFWRRGSRFT